MNIYRISFLKIWTLFAIFGSLKSYGYWWRYALSDYHYYSRRGSYGRYLLKNPTHGVFILNGVAQAVSECRRLFRYNRWNCVSENIKKPFGDIVEKGCRETAFIYALASAGLTYEMIRACSEGRIECQRMCKKDEQNVRQMRFLNATHIVNDRCNDDLRFGFKAWNSFVFEGERSSDIRAMFNIKNSMVGLKEIEKSVHLNCRCYGTSGSCTIFVCTRRVPQQFHLIGGSIYRLYEKAIYDKPDQRTIEDNANYMISHRKAPEEHLNRISPPEVRQQRSANSVRRKRSGMFQVEGLEFFEPSPDFCGQMKYSQLTKNRVCRPKVSAEERLKGMKTCKEICCRGRGWRWVKKLIRTNCKFHYCCKVLCDENETWVKEHYCL